jgi:hypothetical protein
MENFIETQTAINPKNDAKFEEINQQMKNLENQVAQQAIITSRQQGQLPPKPEKNLKEQAKADVFCVDVSTITKVDVMTISPQKDHKSAPKVSTEIPTSLLRYGHCSPDWVQNTENIPPKLQDPGMIVITCTIGFTKISNAMIDQGAGVNLMPKSLFDQIGFGVIEPLNCTLYLDDGSSRRSVGIVRLTSQG